jgi:ribosomal protein S12 methylthiotransferase accessory factor YcaO
MTNHITREANEMFEDTIWEEWKDGDDAQLYDSGYQDGINECIRILKEVAKQPQINRMPSGFAVSVVIATLEETMRKGEYVGT